jgi:hypothetical protein
MSLRRFFECVTDDINRQVFNALVSLGVHAYGEAIPEAPNNVRRLNQFAYCSSSGRLFGGGRSIFVH